MYVVGPVVDKTCFCRLGHVIFIEESNCHVAHFDEPVE